MSDREPTMLESALCYLGLGWNVLPVTADKRPRPDKWEEYQRRRVTEQEARDWWTRWPDANVAVLTGAISGLVVVDVDDEVGLHALGPYLNGKTLTCTTGGGGKHYYLKHPGGTVPNAVRFLPGVDCRGDGGYVVAPPSVHRSGRRYAWEDPGAAPVPLPPGLLAAIRGTGAGRRLESKDWLADVTEGGRDQEMTRRAGRLLQVGMPAGEALAVMLAVNQAHCKPPLEGAQIRKIVESIAGREAAKPRPPAPAEFTVMTQREMVRSHSEGEDRWTVDEWLPEASCGLVVAPPGNYKTWLLVALAHAVATGRPFLGRWAVRGKGPVLFIQQEDPWWMLQSRLARMFNQQEPAEEGGAHTVDCRHVRELDGMPVYWYTGREFHFSRDKMLASLEQKIAELRPRLVMIDPLYTAADSEDYMARGAQRMAALKRMRDKYGCSFVISHHTTVAGSASDSRAAIWGSQFLNAWLEWGWRMPEGDPKGNVIIRHFKSCDNPKRIRLRFKITDWNFGVDIDEKCPGSVTERIEEMILGGVQMKSMGDIAEAVGCSKMAVSQVIKKLGLKKGSDGYSKG